MVAIKKNSKSLCQVRTLNGTIMGSLVPSLTPTSQAFIHRLTPFSILILHIKLAINIVQVKWVLKF
jgi:hypothetical protein